MLKKVGGLTILLLFPLSVFAWSGGPSVVCKKGKPYVFVTTMEVGCMYPSTPYFKELNLKANENGGGKVHLNIGYSSPWLKKPGCDNPKDYYDVFLKSLKLVSNKIIKSRNMNGEVVFIINE